jgi:hypothetical protein
LAVASGDVVRTAIRNAVNDDENTNINKITDAIGDALLYTTVTKAMARLKIEGSYETRTRHTSSRCFSARPR